MIFKLANKTFYKRHILEINKYIVFDDFFHIVSHNLKDKFFSKSPNCGFISKDGHIVNFKSNYDIILLTDVVENHPNVFGLFDEVANSLNNNGKLVISTFNSKYKLIIRLLEILKLKESSVKYSFIQRKKINNIIRGLGFEEVSYHTRQIFPFHVFGLGTFLNLFLETFLNYFKLGIMTYSVFRIQNFEDTKSKKTVIIPAKNEEGNLEPLINRIPKKEKYEILISCGESSDDTLKVANKIKNEENFFEVKVLEQSKTGKANAVWEAAELATGEILAILDADISVDPETLPKFFEIIDNNHADFVNGTRLIYPMEKGSMRSINHFGNRLFQFIVGKIINRPLSDSLCGTKVFRKELFKKILYWQEISKVRDPFGDFDLLFTAAFTGEKIIEYPIHYRARQYGVTQISRFKDGYKLIKYLIYSYFLFNTSKY